MLDVFHSAMNSFVIRLEFPSCPCVGSAGSGPTRSLTPSDKPETPHVQSIARDGCSVRVVRVRVRVRVRDRVGVEVKRLRDRVRVRVRVGDRDRDRNRV